MRGRIYVIPEEDGTLLVECGEDMLEVVVVKRVPLGVRHEAVWTRPITGLEQSPTRIIINPNDETVMLANPQKLDAYSTHSIITALDWAHKNPAMVNPTSLVVGPVHGMDLHGTVNFAGQMQTHFPDVGLTIDLGMAKSLK